MESKQNINNTVSHQAPLNSHTLIIKPKKGWQVIDIRELLRYRDFFYFLANRAIKVRYKQTVSGGLWATIHIHAILKACVV